MTALATPPWRPSLFVRSSTSASAGANMRRWLRRQFSIQRRVADDTAKRSMPTADPRLDDLGRRIEDDYAVIRTDKYATPKHPIVLAHGLMGFDELRIAGDMLPSIQYWRGITEALRANDIEVFTASVPASGSIEERAEHLGRSIVEVARGKEVNIIAHSMGGLDARYMISRLKPAGVRVLSLTTIATPHRGSALADYVFESLDRKSVDYIYGMFESLGMDTGAFSQLTAKYMEEDFNPNTPDDPAVRYFSYGATVAPDFWSVFRQPQRIVQEIDGPNDGLVSVRSSRWGTYKGTLVNVNHLDLINWTNRLKWMVWQMLGTKRKFNAIAFYLDLADMLAKEGI